MIYSHSRISTFIQCMLRFKLQYIDKVKAPMEKSIEAFLGTIVHDSLEKIYTDIKFQNLMTLKDLIQYFNNSWKKNWNNEILIVRKEYGQENYRKMGEKFITDYYNKYYPFNQGRIIALEKRILLNLDPSGRYKLQGYIDRLTDAGNNVYEIHDYKTNSNLPIEEYMKKDRQLALYALAVKENYPDAKKIKLVWHFLAFDKEWVLQKTDNELEDLRKETIDIIRRIEKEKEFKPSISRLCDWCEFRIMCPKFKHVCKTERLTVNEFLNEPGVKLVNMYADLSTKKKKFNEEIDEKLEKMKEAMVIICKKEGLSVLVGSDHNANVWIKEVLKLPGKNDEEREKLEEIIKKSGQWEQLSMLDTFIVSRKMESGELPPELMEKIKSIVKKEEISRIYLKKIPERGTNSEK